MATVYVCEQKYKFEEVALEDTVRVPNKECLNGGVRCPRAH